MADYDHVLALSDINLEIPTNKIFVIMGLSGSGKSTLIRHFNRIIEPTVGRIELDGRDILTLDENELRELRRKEISMVFQRFALMPHRTTIENVAYGLSIQGVPHENARQTARALDCARRGCRVARTIILHSCPAACSSVWDLRGRLPQTLKSC